LIRLWHGQRCFIPCLSGLFAKSDRLIYFQGMEMRGFPLPCLSFNGFFPDDAACAAYLEHLPGPRVLFAPIAPSGRAIVRAGRPSCCAGRACKKNTSLTVGNGHRSSHTPLSTWFWPLIC